MVEAPKCYMMQVEPKDKVEDNGNDGVCKSSDKAVS